MQSSAMVTWLQFPIYAKNKNVAEVWTEDLVAICACYNSQNIREIYWKQAVWEFSLCPQLLDINEQPIGGGRELKRRKKLAGNKSTHTVTLQLVTSKVLSEKSRGQSIIQLPTLM